jgi:hypothetical protein
MDSAEDTALKRWVAPFGNSGINDRSHLPRTYRSVPRPSSPLDAKAFTRCPSLPHHHPTPATGPDELTRRSTSLALRRMQSRTGSMEREPLRITTNVEHPVRPNPDNRPASLVQKPEQLPDRPAVTQSRKTPYDDKQHSQQGQRLSGKPSSQERANPLPVRGALHPRTSHGRPATSHRRRWWARADSNGRPHPYQGCALTD